MRISDWSSDVCSSDLGLPGLTGQAAISRDSRGVVYITAETPADASFALGFAHAQDRLWQMEMTRRIGAGRLAELVGDAALPIDRMIRTLGLHRLAETNLRRLSPAALAQDRKSTRLNSSH